MGSCFTFEPDPRTLYYDNSGHALDLKDTYANGSLPTTEVIRTYDAYGQVLTDQNCRGHAADAENGSG